jgi:hypothetical protein
MAITSGSYTVGSGGDYATWKAAFDDFYNQTLTGNLTITQISDVTETSTRTITTNLDTFTLTLTSSVPHLGDPTKGWLTTLNYATNLTFAFLSGLAGTGTCEIKNLKFSVSASLLVLFVHYSGSTATTKIHDNLVVEGNYVGNFIEINSNATLVFYNNVVNHMSKLWLKTGGTAKGVRNCVAYNCATGFGASGDALYNCAAFNCVTADFGAQTGTFTKCASSDATGSEAALRSLTAANCFASVDKTKSNFLDILQGGPLWETGNASVSSGQTTDIRGRTIPNGKSLYSIGASTAWKRSIIRVSTIVIPYFTKGPTATADTAYWITSNSTYATPNTDRFGAGAFDGTYYGYGGACRILAVPIAKNSKIISAYLTVVCSTAFTGTDCRTYFDAIDEDNAGVPAAPYATFMARARTTAQTAWNITAVWVVGTSYVSPDISAVIQEIVDRASWASGNALLLCWNNNSSPTTANNLRRCANYGHATYAAPSLKIEFSQP